MSLHDGNFRPRCPVDILIRPRPPAPAAADKGGDVGPEIPREGGGGSGFAGRGLYGAIRGQYGSCKDAGDPSKLWPQIQTPAMDLGKHRCPPGTMDVICG